MRFPDYSPPAGKENDDSNVQRNESHHPSSEYGALHRRLYGLPACLLANDSALLVEGRSSRRAGSHSASTGLRSDLWNER